jgi:hypothetical protein
MSQFSGKAKTMCTGISLASCELPEQLVTQHKLSDRIVRRSVGADLEIHFLYRHRQPLIPAWFENQLQIFPWGNRDNANSRLPRTGWCQLESLEAGHWNWLTPESVEIPATFGREKGIWYQVREGMRGILVRDEQNHPHIYMLTTPASHYYEVMTRNKRMPVLVGEEI